MKAIPTTYRNTTFRSRLEASWAAHFDQLGMPWTYEPEGFSLSDGTYYLPDFYLPTSRAWAEVKGEHQERISKVEQFADDLWRESEAKDTYDQKSPMVILFHTPHYSIRDRFGFTDGSWKNLSPLGVMGPGKRYSVAIARCPNCNTATIAALWQAFCRNCGHVHEGSLDAWHESVRTHWNESHGDPKWFRPIRSRMFS